jgi:hypothetical protein
VSSADGAHEEAEAAEAPEAADNADDEPRAAAGESPGSDETDPIPVALPISECVMWRQNTSQFLRRGKNLARYADVPSGRPARAPLRPFSVRLPGGAPASSFRPAGSQNR